MTRTFDALIPECEPAGRPVAVGLIVTALAVGGAWSCDSEVLVSEASTVRVVVQGRDLEDFPGLVVSIEGAGVVQTFEQEDFQPDTTPNPQLTSPRVSVPDAGAISVSVSLASAEESVTGEASFALDSGTRWRALLAIASAEADPSFECRGCLDQHAIPLPEELVPERFLDEVPISLWMVWIREDESG